MSDPKQEQLIEIAEAQLILQEAIKLAADKITNACKMDLPEFRMLIGDPAADEKTVETLAIILLTRAIIQSHKPITKHGCPSLE